MRLLLPAPRQLWSALLDWTTAARLATTVGIPQDLARAVCEGLDARGWLECHDDTFTAVKYRIRPDRRSEAP